MGQRNYTRYLKMRAWCGEVESNERLGRESMLAVPRGLVAGLFALAQVAPVYKSADAVTTTRPLSLAGGMQIF